ncbi:MAG: hypothetical protein H0W61_15000 [Bacteroidetes bacterium]|nr:hypothetical protein [Bacteroidota bacterium]
MKVLIAVAFASLYGLTVRVLFGFMDNVMEIMGITFLALVPALIGFITIILLPKHKEVSWVGAFFIPWLTCAALLVITIAVSLEGSICWVMVYPFFAALAGVGGVLANAVRKRKKRIVGSNKWGNPNVLNVSAILMLPMLLGFFEGDNALTLQVLVIKKEISINADAARVWYALTNINEIKEKEHSTSLSEVLGFPKHINTMLDTLCLGGKRIANYERGLYFNETITCCIPEKLLSLTIKTDPGKIPSTVMDEHILIGGRHLDILSDSYELEKLSDGNTRLTLSSRFSICTPFNWYASIWARYLMSDILQGELELIKKRCTPEP